MLGGGPPRDNKGAAEMRVLEAAAFNMRGSNELLSPKQTKTENKILIPEFCHGKFCYGKFWPELQSR